MLVTTAKAEGTTVNLRGTALTFYFPTSKAPAISTAEDLVLIGNQRVGMEKGNLVFKTLD